MMIEPVSTGQNLALTDRQEPEVRAQRVALLRGECVLERVQGSGIGHTVMQPQRGIILLAGRRVERCNDHRGVAEVPNRSHAQAGAPCDARVADRFEAGLVKLRLCAPNRCQLLPCPGRDADHSRVDDRVEDRATNQPSGVGRKPDPAPVIESLGRVHEADHPFLNEIGEGDTAGDMRSGCRKNQPQIALDELAPGVSISALDRSREAHLLLTGEQGQRSVGVRDRHLG